VLVGVSYAFNYAFYLAISRSLSVELFGAVGGLLAILGLLTLASTATTYASSRLVAEEGTPARAAQVRWAYLRFLVPLALVAALLAIFTVLQSMELAVLVATAGIVPLRDLHCGLLSGLKLNFRWGAVVLVESVIRLAGAGLTPWYPFAWVAMAAWLVSLAAGTLLGMAFLPREALRKSDAPVPDLRRTSIEASLLRAPQVSFLNIDVVIAAAVFGFSPATGLYFAAATLSRIPFYLATTHALGELAPIVEEKGRGPATSRALRYGLLLGALLALPLMLLPGLALAILFPGYESAALILAILSVTSFLLVQANSLSTILFASGKGRLSAGILIAGAALEVGLGALGAIALGSVGLALATVTAALATTLLLAAPTLSLRRSPSKR
jgi:O-antigen/teichoic acid export membrane protein